MRNREVRWRWTRLLLGTRVPSPERRVIRVEREETQDYVRETLAVSQEEADETAFMPSVLSEPRGASPEVYADCLNGD